MDEDKIREMARLLVSESGPDVAAERLGVARATALSLAAGARCTRATFALVRERLAQQADA